MDVQKLKDLMDGVYHPVEKPFHYNWLQKEVIDIIKDCLTPEEFIGYLKGNVIKYSLRAGLKDYDKLDEDLGKRNKYLRWLLDELKEKPESVDNIVDYWKKKDKEKESVNGLVKHLGKITNNHEEECLCPDCRYLYG